MRPRRAASPLRHALPGSAPAGRLQKALDDRHIPYEVVVGPWKPKDRTAVIEGTGQPLYPAILFEDGSWYRAESKEMAETIREGRA